MWLPGKQNTTEKTELMGTDGAFRCLIVDEMHESLLPMLAGIGVEGDYRPGIAAGEIGGVLAAGGYGGLIVRSKIFVSGELLRRAPGLRVVCRAGAGVDNVDEAALAAAGVELINAPEGNRDAVGEFCVGLLLGLLRYIPRAHAEVGRGEWRREANRGTELGNLTVGIIGFGHMGEAFARRLSGFGCEVIACDLFPEKINASLARPVRLEELQNSSDVISLHVPLTTTTRRMVNASWLAACTREVWLLNTSRGEVVDTGALVGALRAGRVRGAALDVLENERLGTLTPAQAADLAYLQQHPRVVLTPHIAGWTTDSYERINRVLVSKLERFVKAREGCPDFKFS